MGKRFASVVRGFLACASFAGVCSAGDPVVTNVRASQRQDGSKKVDIYYDVADSDNDPLTVSVTVRTGGVAIAASSFTNSVGAGIMPGTNRQVVWDAGKDWNGNYSTDVKFVVMANDGRAPAGMVQIPGGTNSGIDPDFGAYSLTVEAFYMDATEVTKAQWDGVYTWAVAHGYSFDHAGWGKATNHPVHNVSWYDCVKWCNARSEKEGRTPCYNLSAWACNFAANGYRLPTVTEWVYAARGGLSGKRFPWGDTITHGWANYCSSSSYSYDVSLTRNYHSTYATGLLPFTSPTGAFAANGYGLYDMAGNVNEWCSDTTTTNWYFQGGEWSSNADRARCSNSQWFDPETLNYAFVGFRAVCR